MTRVDRVRALLAGQRLDAIVVHNPETRTCLTGVVGSAGVALVTGRETLLLVDFRYVGQAAAEAPGWEVVQVPRQATDIVTEIARGRELRRVGFESDGLTYKQYDELAVALRPTELVPVAGVDRLRWIKDADELARIRTAVAIADAGFTHIQGYLRPGVQEREIALELEFYMRRQGADKEAFETTVASGVRSSLPHGRESEKVLRQHDFITLDIGAVVRGFHSDCTHTIVPGDASPRHRELYDLGLAAQPAALQGIRPGIAGRAADALARRVLTE